MICRLDHPERVKPHEARRDSFLILVLAEKDILSGKDMLSCRDESDSEPGN